MAYVSLGRLPGANKTRVSTIQNLRGGLNIHDMAWQIKSNQSPGMKNVWWSDGALRTRPDVTVYNTGLVTPRTEPEKQNYEELRAYGYEYMGWFVIHNPERHCFTAIAAADISYYVDVAAAVGATAFPVEFGNGMFFVYNEVLYYKSAGGYYQLTPGRDYDPRAEAYKLVATDVIGYEPTTYINCIPDKPDADGTHRFGSGEWYQPRNRLSYARRLTYNCTADTTVVVTPEPTRPIDEGGIEVAVLQLDGSWEPIDAPQVELFNDRTVLTFSGGELGAALTTAGTAALTNNVRVRYLLPRSPEDDIIFDSIMQCNIVTTYGGSTGLFVVMAGYDRQPNAYFWCGNTSVAIDPTYFPVESYNLCGDYGDPITAFGKQQNMLIIFQKHQIGRSVYSTVEVDKRVMVTMNYTVINPEIGCDVPGSVQLIENNLVFANSSRGILFLRDSSSVHENNVATISRNVEQPSRAAGILYDLNNLPLDTVTSYDDGSRYWLMANGHAWLWDYSINGDPRNDENLSWFYFDEFELPACWLDLDAPMPMMIGRDGFLRRFEVTYTDTTDAEGVWLRKGSDFTKELTLPIQDFDVLEVLKDVTKLILVAQGTGNSFIELEYETDYSLTKDPTPVYLPGKIGLVPRDLRFRSLRVTPFATTAVRKPRCIHIRHFKVTLRNSKRGDDIAFVSAQIFYRLKGVDR